MNYSATFFKFKNEGNVVRNMIQETKIILDIEQEVEMEQEREQKKVIEEVTITNTPYDELKKGYFMLPNEIHRAMTVLKLSQNEKLVYLYLVRLAHNSGLPFPSYTNIMDNTGISTRNTLANVLKGLEVKNLIKRIHRGNSRGQANTYKVNYIQYQRTEKDVYEEIYNKEF